MLNDKVDFNVINSSKSIVKHHGQWSMVDHKCILIFHSVYLICVVDVILRFLVEWNTNSKNCHVAQTGENWFTMGWRYLFNLSLTKYYIINKYNTQLFPKYYDSTSRLIMGCILATIVWILLTLPKILFPLSSSLFQALR